MPMPTKITIKFAQALGKRLSPCMQAIDDTFQWVREVKRRSEFVYIIYLPEKDQKGFLYIKLKQCQY